MFVRSLFGLGVAFCFAAGTVVPAQAQGASVPKIAVIDVQKIIEESATGKKALESLKEYHQQEEERLKAKQQEIEQLRAQISEGGLSLSEERLEELRKQLEDRSIELRRANDDATREFNKRQQQALQGIERMVMPVIQQVGQEGGYTLIFNKFESGLVFATDAIDITPAIIERLDAQQSAG